MSETGKLKLALFADKMDSIMRVSRGEKPYDETYPISVELALTNKCNLNCVWCCDSQVRTKFSGHIDKEILFSLIDDLARGGTKGITVEGGGEPTLHPDFEEIIHKIKEAGLAIGLITNGLNIDKVSPNLDYFEWIRISLDADSHETFKKFKGSNGFDQVLGNIKILSENKKKTVLGVGYVATRYNLGNIEDVISAMQSFGVNYFYLRPVEDNEQLSSKNDMEWLKQYSTPDFEIIVNYHGRISGGNSKLPCVCHSIVSVISADATVYICGRLHIHPEHEPIGNLEKESFYDIWNGKRRVELTQMLRDSSFTQKHCPVCRITKYNEFADEIVNTKTVNFI